MAAHAVKLLRANFRLIVSAVALVVIGAAALVSYSWYVGERDQPPPFPHGEIRIGIDATYPPFAIVTEDGLQGLDIDLGLALGDHLNIPVRFVNMGIDGLYDSLRADQVDIVISAFQAEARHMADVLYTRSYFNAGLVLVSSADNPISSMRDLSARALAYEFGSLADAETRLWSRRISNFETLPYELPTHALDAVRLGAADAALADAVSARLYLHDHPDWHAHSSHVTNVHFVIAVSIRRGRTWEVTDRALGEILRNGVVEAIIRHWL